MSAPRRRTPLIPALRNSLDLAGQVMITTPVHGHGVRCRSYELVSGFAGSLRCGED